MIKTFISRNVKIHDINNTLLVFGECSASSGFRFMMIMTG